jgi:hypothetical protein
MGLDSPMGAVLGPIDGRALRQGHASGAALAPTATSLSTRMPR